MKKIVKYMASIVAVCCLSTSGITANAATVDEVASVARSLNVSETVIQQALNQYYAEPEKYPPDVLDNVIVCLYAYQDDLDDIIADTLGPQAPEASEPTTEAPTDAPVSTDVPSSSNNGNSSSNSGNSANNSNSSDKIESSEFINMTLQEKIDYANTLSEEERTEFINSLSGEEKNSILKQLSAEDKMNILSNFIDAGSAMGMNFQVDELTNESLSMSIRDSEGNLIDVSNVGTIVEDTGIDYSLLAAVTGSAVAMSLAGIYFIYRKLNKFNKAEEKNDR